MTPQYSVVKVMDSPPYPINQFLNESLCSENMGYLAALHFLKHYQLYHGITIEKSTKLHFCDNSGLISQFSDAYKSAEASSFGFLKTDYDVHMQIMTMIKQMDIVIPT
jgi:hypothetical protein